MMIDQRVYDVCVCMIEIVITHEFELMIMRIEVKVTVKLSVYADKLLTGIKLN